MSGRSIRLGVAGLGRAFTLMLPTFQRDPRVQLVAGDRTHRPLPADVPFGELHLPRTVHAPDPWAPGTEETGPPGPLAVLAADDRERLDGLRATTVMSWYGVSAVDGAVHWLDLPSSQGTPGRWPGSAALSPDGRVIAYSRFSDEEQSHLVGWTVYDTTTGETLDLDPARGFEIRPDTLIGDMMDLAFSGDSHYLVTFAGSRATPSTKQLVAWDVETGEPSLAERTTAYWQPNLGLAPSGVLWTRNKTAYLFHPDTGETSLRQEPRWPLLASYGPSGAFAYVGHDGPKVTSKRPWTLYVAPAGRQAREVALGFEPRRIDGWRDEQRVVVDDGETYAVVDITTGKSSTERLTGLNGWGGLASDLWANDLVEGTRPPHVVSPLLVRRAGLGLAVLTLGGAALIWWRRVRHGG